MKFFASLPFLICATAVSAQQQCVSIENDIERLACFDTAFANRPNEAASRPEDAFIELASLLTSMGTKWNGLPAMVDATFDDESCNLTVVRIESAGCSARECLIRQTGVRFDAGDLDSVQPGRNGALLQMQRGKEIRTYEFENGIGEFPATIDTVAEYMGETVRFFVNATTQDMEFMTAQPSTEIQLLTSESNVDGDEILAALNNLSAACRSR